MEYFVRDSQSGQVGIAIVLIMVVLSTVGISLATRSTRDVQTSRQTQEATQTFGAAESALEDVLSRGQTYLDVTSEGNYNANENIPVNYTVEKQNQLATEVLQGSAVEVNVAGRSAGQDVIDIEWSNTSNCSDTPASLLLSIVNTAGAEPVSRYLAYSLCERNDGFTLVATEGSLLSRKISLSLQADDSVVRITPVYNDTSLFVAGSGWELPVQEYTVQSVARNEIGRATKAIQVERTREYAPSILDYALISGTTIVK